MKRFAVAVAAIFLAWGCEYDAAAGATTYTPSQATVADAARAMGVSQTQATVDLAAQHEIFLLVGPLQAAGDQVWFDDSSATLHVYGPNTGIIPTSFAVHTVWDNAPPSTPAVVTATAASCGGSPSEFLSGPN
jgi:hypothetical protein